MRKEERVSIGFYYAWSDAWLGGVFYTHNLFKALNSLKDEDKPIVYFYCYNKKYFEDLKSDTGYPYLKLVLLKNKTIIQRAILKILRLLVGDKSNSLFNKIKFLPSNVMIYPCSDGNAIEKLVYWKADFQEKHLPEYFSSDNIASRDREIRKIAESGAPFVFSSYDCENDFKSFYPQYHNKTFVVHFAVSHSDFSYLNILDLKKKYGIKGDYVLCANQFWQHKNHLFLFKSFLKASQQGFNKQLVCTGKMEDFRNPDYIEKLNKFLHDNNQNEIILLLGIIETDELHCLMQHAYAIVQPSLFEGWNTTVEDCKALNKFVFLSDLPVHREQATTNVCFFNPHDENDLCHKLLTVIPTEETNDYSKNFREFGESFSKVIKYMASRNS